MATTIRHVQFAAPGAQTVSQPALNLTTEGTLDWWHAKSSGDVTSFVRKAGGGAIGVAPYGGYTNYSKNAWAGAQISWTDGNSPTSGADSVGINLANYQTTANAQGLRITVPAPQWPDWRTLKLSFGVYVPRVEFRGSINDGDTSITVQEFVPLTDEFFSTQAVKFASLQSGRTFTLDVRILDNHSAFAISGITLFLGPPSQFPARGLARAMALSGVSGPLGAR